MFHAYEEGLTGAQAVWANRKYHGHHTLPSDMIKEVKASVALDNVLYILYTPSHTLILYTDPIFFFHFEAQLLKCLHNVYVIQTLGFKLI